MSIINARLPTRSARNKAELSRHAASPLYDILRFEIVSLSLKPGSVINRVDIQNRFGVSSTPLRDALMRLGGEGLVDVVPQSATRVSLIDVNKAHAAQFLRRALELEAIKTISEATDRAVVAELRDLVARQKDAAARQDF